jgi:hypothetical protein
VKGFGVLCCDFSATGGEVENPKSEARNPKQYPMTKIQMTKTDFRGFPFLNLAALVF